MIWANFGCYLSNSRSQNHPTFWNLELKVSNCYFCHLFLLFICCIALWIFCVPVVMFGGAVFLLRLVVTVPIPSFFKKGKSPITNKKKRCAGCLAIVSGFCRFLFFPGFGGKKMKERKKQYDCTRKPAHTCGTPN